MKKISAFYSNFATVFGLGYFPVASGTVGSFAGLILCMLLHKFLLLYIITFIVLFLIGVTASGKMEEALGEKDPHSVVIDEFACIFLVFLFIPMTPLYVVTGFILYRILDILKIPPIKRMEDQPKGWGIMLDDLVVGIYTNLILQVIRLFVR